MRKAIVVCLVAVGLVVSAGTAAATSHTGSVEIEAADDSDTDSTTLSYTFTATANGSVSVSTEDPGTGVTATFTGWSGGGDSGTSSTWTVENGETYTVEYEVTADSDASEQTYFFDSDITGPGATHTETLELDVAVLDPSFDFVSTQNADVTLTGSDTTSTELDVSFTNDGDGEMQGISASTSGVPSGLSVSTSTPDSVSANSDGEVELDIEADESLNEGTETFTVTLTDSLGNSEEFDVDVEIETAPVIDSSLDTVDVGDVLVGESATTTFSIEETAGYESVNGVDVTYTDSAADGSIELPGIDTTFISAGSSTTQDVTITAGDDALQHSDLEWEAELTPEATNGIGTTVNFEGRVIYPPYYESVAAEDATIVMDEPRDQTSGFTETVTVTVENGGDQAMQLTDVTPTVSGSSVTATVIDRPNSIPAQSNGTIDVQVSAASSAAEGDRELSVTVDAREPGTETVDSTITVEQETELTVDDTALAYGEVVATQTVTRSTTINERLGYHDIENFTVTRVSGPDSGWLTATDEPSAVGAGESESFVTSLTFDTTAEFFVQQTWVYRIDGDNVEAQNVTVTATPRPIDFTATVEDINEYEGDSGQRDAVATETAGAMEDLAGLLRNNSSQSTRADVPTVSAAGRSTALFLQYTAEADSQIADGNYQGAQTSVTRSAATYNTMASAATRVSQPDVAARLNDSVAAADEILNGLIEDQRAYYQQQLEADNTSMLERAQTYRQLAQLSELAGDDDQAESYRNQSESSFEEYSTLISDGNANLQQARTNQSELESDHMVTVLGQPMFWIGDLDQVTSERDDINASFNQAEQQFVSAGATSQAQTVRNERTAFADRFQRARLLSFGIAGLLGILFVVVLIREALALYRYVQESAEAVTGDFLVTSETS